MQYFNSVLLRCCLGLSMLVVISVPCRGELIDASLPKGTVVLSYENGVMCDQHGCSSVDALDKDAEVPITDSYIDALFDEETVQQQGKTELDDFVNSDLPVEVPADVEKPQ